MIRLLRYCSDGLEIAHEFIEAALLVNIPAQSCDDTAKELLVIRIPQVCGLWRITVLSVFLIRGARFWLQKRVAPSNTLAFTGMSCVPSAHSAAILIFRCI